MEKFVQKINLTKIAIENRNANIVALRVAISSTHLKITLRV